MPTKLTVKLRKRTRTKSSFLHGLSKQNTETDISMEPDDFGFSYKQAILIQRMGKEAALRIAKRRGKI